MNIARISRRIGLGGVNEFAGYNSSDGIVETALDAPVIFMVIPMIGGDIKKWPLEKEFGLNDRIHQTLLKNGT